MSQIVLSDDQIKAFQAATDAVELRDQSGNLLGYVSRPPARAEIADAQRRLASDGPWYTTREVLNHLESLERR